MSPSGADIDIVFSPTSIIEGFRKVDRARQEMERGVAGAAERWDKAFTSFSQQITTVSQRAQRAQESYIKSIERQAAAYGKSGEEKMIANRDQLIRKLGDNKTAIDRVTAAYQKMIDVEKQQSTKGLEQEMKALERQAALFGKSGVEKLAAQRDLEIQRLNGKKDAIDRVTASYQKMINVEEQEARVVKEREIGVLQQRAGMAGTTGTERLMAERAEAMKRFGNDTRVAASYEQMLTAETRKETQALESELKALERRASLHGKSGKDRLIAERDEEIKKLGQNKEAIDRVTAAYQKMIEAEGRGGHGGGGTANLVFRGVRDIFEGRTNYGVMDLGQAALRGMGGGGGTTGAGMLAGISTSTLVIGGLTTALLAAEIAGYKAAVSMGEYARQVREIQEITGMSSREVQQLEIAAKLSGRSVEDVAHGMRGFTQALEGGGSAAEKAAKDLERMGVDVVGLRLGTISTYDALEQMGKAMQKNGDTFETNIELMDVFKKSGLNIKQLLGDMAEAKEIASKTPLFSEEEFKQMDEMRKQWATVKVEMDNMFQRLKFWAAQEFTADFNLIVTIKHGAEAIAEPFIQGNQVNAAFTQRILQDIGIMGFDQPNRITLPVQKPPQSIPEFLKGRSEQFDQFISGAGTSGLPGAEQKLRQLEKDLSSLHEKTDKNLTDFVKSPLAYLENERKISAEYEKQKTLVENIKKAESDRKNIAEALRRLSIDVTERLEHPYGMLAADQKLKSILEMHGVTDADKRKAASTTGILRFEETEMKIQRGIDEANAAARKVAETLGVAEPESTKTIEQQNERVTSARNRQLLENTRRQMEEDKEALRPLLQIQTEQRQNEEAAALRSVRLGGILQPSTIESRLAAEAQIAAIKERNADQEAADARTRVAQEYTTKENYENDLVAIRLKNEGEVDKAREEYQAKYLEELRHQVDSIKSAVEPLFHTLFTNPKQFGQQLRSTITEATLKPITSGLSEVTSMALHPLIFGATGTGGIAGSMRNMFGGGRLNDVHLINGSVPVHVTGGSVGGGGGMMPAGTSIFGGWRGGGGGTFGSPGAPGGTPGFAPGPIFGPPGGGAPYNIFGGPDLTNLPMQTPSYTGAELARMTLGSALGGSGGGWDVNSGMGPAAMGGGFGGGTASGGRGLNLGGIAGFAQGLKGSWKQLLGFGAVRGATPGSESLERAGEGPGITPGGAFSLKGLGNSPLAKAGAGTVGMMLAQAGLLGNARGTGLGVAEGMLGGAGIGFAMGGPLGAGIGAAVGLGIGLGEVIAGVESPRNEAKRLVQSIYHIQINNPTADQIVNIANQSYAGRVSLAVRAPEVRHMLGLYAAGTGQGSVFQQSANEAHGASLVESGGRLQQQSTYQYGQAFTQSSNLPVYGSVPGQVYGAPGGGMQLSLNIGGQDAARFLQGNVVSPEVIQTQYASAMNGSTGRVSQALMMSQPGSIAG